MQQNTTNTNTGETTEAYVLRRERDGQVTTITFFISSSDGVTRYGKAVQKIERPQNGTRSSEIAFILNIDGMETEFSSHFIHDIPTLRKAWDALTNHRHPFARVQS